MRGDLQRKCWLIFKTLSIVFTCANSQTVLACAHLPAMRLAVRAGALAMRRRSWRPAARPHMPGRQALTLSTNEVGAGPPTTFCLTRRRYGLPDGTSHV